MSGVISVIGRPVGADDISFGQGSFVYVDINGVTRRIGQVNAVVIPWNGFPGYTVQSLVDGTKVMPVGASNLQVVNTSILSGPIYGSGTTSGYVKNYASGLLQFGASIATADLPSGIPATYIGSGTVSDAEFGYVDGATSNIQVQIDGINSSIAGFSNLAYFQPTAIPNIVWTSTTVVQVNAAAESPSYVLMCGFPDVVNYGQMITTTYNDSLYYYADSAVTCTFPNNIWGDTGVAREKAYQWYALYAVPSGTAFDIKAMPIMRYSSQASQVITLRNNYNNGDIGYGLTTDELVDGSIYVLSGSSKGLIRTITANNDNNAAGGTITYSGAALTMTQGDWLIVLPPENFRFLGTVYNNSGSDIFHFVKLGSSVQWVGTVSATATGSGTVSEYLHFCCPLATSIFGYAYLNGGTYAALGHPSTTYGNGTITIAAATSTPFTSNIYMCTLFISYDGTNIPVNIAGYSYPANCGY